MENIGADNERQGKEMRKKQIIIIAIVLLLCIAVTTTVVFITRNSGRKQEDQTVASGEAHPEEQVADSREDTSENATLSSNSTEGKKESEEENTTEEDSQSETKTSTEEAGKTTTELGSTANGNKPTGGTTNNNPLQTTAQSTTQAPNTTEQPTGGNQGGGTHQHTWEAQYRTVHHDEEGHYGDVCVKEAYDEPIYGTHYVCNYCGLDLGNDQLSHCLKCGPPLSEDDIRYVPGIITTAGSSYGTIRVQVGTTHHEAVYEKKWVVDKKAYDEQVLDGYKCTTCGATK